MTSPYRVVVAPDKFKGSLRAEEVSEAIASVLASRPGVEIVEHPVADGGEGTVAVALAAGFEPVTVVVTGPLGQPVEATFALHGSRAVIEMASAAGLALLPEAPGPGTAWRATTFGVGELILAAIDRGATHLVVGAGGSATTDGGVGAVEALGADVRALGQQPHQREPARTGLDPRLAGVDIVVACDVDNPLLGPAGAAAVYGPQKGADPRCVADLEGRLMCWADAVAAATGTDVRDLPGVGAAGGLAFGLVAVLGARLVSGVELLLELTGFDRLAASADLVIVGEGSLDHQSLRGKGPVGVARAASAHGTAVVAVTGRNALTEPECREAGLQAVYSLGDVESDPQVCMRDARRLLSTVSARIAADWLPSADRVRATTKGP